MGRKLKMTDLGTALTELREIAVTGHFNGVITALMQPESNSWKVIQ